MSNTNEKNIQTNDIEIFPYPLTLSFSSGILAFTQYDGEEWKRPMTLDTAKRYITNWKRFVEYFGEEILVKVIPNFKNGDFATTFEVQADNYGMLKHYCLKGAKLYSTDKHYSSYTEYKGEWQREVRKLSYSIFSADNHQLAEKHLFRLCLEEKYEWLKLFKVQCYHFDHEIDKQEVYIMTEVGKSLYVPLKALEEHKPELVTKRMVDYYSDYYSITIKPENQVHYDHAVSALDTPTAKRLFAYMGLVF